VKAVHDDFCQVPPVPKKASAPQVQAVSDSQARQLHAVQLAPPNMAEVQQMFGDLKPEEMKSLMEPDNEVLLGMIINDPSFDAVKAEIRKQISEVFNLIENCKQTERELEQMATSFEIKYVQYLSLKERLNHLKQQEAIVLNKMSKQAVVAVLDRKIRGVDDEGRKLEKEF